MNNVYSIELDGLNGYVGKYVCNVQRNILDNLHQIVSYLKKMFSDLFISDKSSCYPKLIYLGK